MTSFMCSDRYSIKPTKLNQSNQFHQTKSREIKSKENKTKGQYQLELSLAQLSPSLSNLFSGIRNDPDIVFDEKFYQEVLEKKKEFENLNDNEQNERG